MLDHAGLFISDQTTFSVTTKWDKIKQELQERVELEEKKYPMTTREKILYDTICEILSTLPPYVGSNT